MIDPGATSAERETAGFHIEPDSLIRGSFGVLGFLFVLLRITNGILLAYKKVSKLKTNSFRRISFYYLMLTKRNIKIFHTVVIRNKIKRKHILMKKY